MGLVARKPVFGVSDKARRKSVSSATETSYKDEISGARSMSRYDTFQSANNKGADQAARMPGWSVPLLFAPPRRLSRRSP